MAIPKTHRWLVAANKKLLKEQRTLAEQQRDLPLLIASNERYTASVLRAAFENDMINGKNAEQRKIQTDDLLLNDDVVSSNARAVADRRFFMAITTAQIKYLETLIRIGLSVIGASNDTLV